MSKYEPVLAESGCRCRLPVPMMLTSLNVTLPVLAAPPAAGANVPLPYNTLVELPVRLMVEMLPRLLAVMLPEVLIKPAVNKLPPVLLPTADIVLNPDMDGAGLAPLPTSPPDNTI